MAIKKTLDPVVESVAKPKKQKLTRGRAVSKKVKAPRKNVVANKYEKYDALIFDQDNPKHSMIARFIEEYLVDLNGTQSAIRAGYSTNSADVISCQLLGNGSVKNAIEKLKAERSERLQVTQDDVLKLWHRAATIDSNELMHYRRACCRCCWGKDFRFQETPNEHRARLKQYKKDRDIALRNKREPPEWDDDIEIGFMRAKPPNKDCPECCGEGEGRAFFKDSAEMSEAARAVYCGVKVGKEGTEVMVISKEKAYDALSRHVGFYEKDKEASVFLKFDRETMEREFVAVMNAARERQALIERERGILIEHGE